MERRWERFNLSCTKEKWNKHCKEAHLDPAKGKKKKVNSYTENYMAVGFGLCKDGSIADV